MSRGFAWLDISTHEALTEATEIVKAVEKRTGLKIACLEEIGYRMGLISKVEVAKQKSGSKGNYYEYLSKVAL
jgi:glucose-1-phosphate thymidylyltransferase